MKKKNQYELDRRDFLLTSATALGGLMLPQISAQASGQQKAVVMVFLRGGLDGLSLMPPKRNSGQDYTIYSDARKDLKVTNPLPLNNQFELHPGCTRLRGLWNANDLIMIPGAGSKSITRSHFAQQDLIEQGNTTGGTPQGGFLNRALAAIPQNNRSNAMPSATVGNSLDKSLRGNAPAHTVPALSTGLTINGITATKEMNLETRLDTLWRGIQYLSPKWIDLLLRSSGNEAKAGIPVLREAAGFPTSQFSPATGQITDTHQHYAGLDQFQIAARLLKADPGIKYLTLNIGGWDHHHSLGPNDGRFFTLISKLDRALGAFAADLQRAGIWKNVRVVVMSEFGRRVEKNGAGGTDHGRGGVMMVMGGNLRGKRVLERDWNLNNLENGDVRVTVDYRDVLAELMVRFQGINQAQIASIFPYYTMDFLGIT